MYIPQNNCNIIVFIAKSLIDIPRMTYQNFIRPVDGWEIYVFEERRNTSFFVFSGVILHLPQIY